MVKILEATDLDPISDQVDAVLTAAEEREAEKRFAYTPDPGDLSDGGVTSGAKVTPMSGWGGRKLEKGRPAARRAWSWNGTETTLPLAWNPDGTMHDGARRYLLKRHCLCCHNGGFRGRQCPNCVKNGCVKCRASTDPKLIIPNFYLRKEDVPFPVRFYGPINCFLPFCPRRDGSGFLTEQEMRLHARTRHRLEYQAHEETLAAAKRDEAARTRDELEALRQRLDAFTQSQLVAQAPRAVPVRRKRGTASRRKAAGGVAG